MKKVDLNRYTSGLKRDQKYKEAIDAVLHRLSVNLNIPIQDLYNGLFFARGTNAKGILTIKGDVPETSLKAIRKHWQDLVKGEEK